MYVSRLHNKLRVKDDIHHGSVPRAVLTFVEDATSRPMGFPNPGKRRADTSRSATQSTTTTEEVAGLTSSSNSSGKMPLRNQRRRETAAERKWVARGNAAATINTWSAKEEHAHEEQQRERKM